MLFKNIIISWDIFRHRLRCNISYFIRRNNTGAPKTTSIAFIQSFPTDLPESWKPFSILHVFFSSLSPSHGAEGLFAWERSRNCGRFSSFSSRPFIRKPRRCDQLCRLAITAEAFAILWDFYVRFLFYASATLCADKSCSSRLDDSTLVVILWTLRHLIQK